MIPRRWLAALVAVSCGGCASLTGLGRARTLDPGRTQFGATVELSSNSARLNGQTNVPWGHVGVAFRRGLHERFELGGRFSCMGIDGADSIALWVDPKIQIVRSPSATHGIDLAIVPSVGWQQVRLGGTPWHLPQVALAVLFGVNLGPHQLVLGARGGYQALIGTSMVTQHIGWGAVSIGGVFRAGRWDISPELVLGWAPVTFNGESTADTQPGAGLGQIGFSFAHQW